MPDGLRQSGDLRTRFEPANLRSFRLFLLSEPEGLSRFEEFAADDGAFVLLSLRFEGQLRIGEERP